MQQSHGNRYVARMMADKGRVQRFGLNDIINAVTGGGSDSSSGGGGGATGAISNAVTDST